MHIGIQVFVMCNFCNVHVQLVENEFKLIRVFMLLTNHIFLKLKMCKNVSHSTFQIEYRGIPNMR